MLSFGQNTPNVTNHPAETRSGAWLLIFIFLCSADSHSCFSKSQESPVICRVSICDVLVADFRATIHQDVRRDRRYCQDRQSYEKQNHTTSYISVGSLYEPDSIDVYKSSETFILMQSGHGTMIMGTVAVNTPLYEAYIPCFNRAMTCHETAPNWICIDLVV